MSADDRVRRVLLAAFVAGMAVSITLAETALVLLALRLAWRVATGRARMEGWPLGWPLLAWAAASLLAALASAEPLAGAVLALRGLGLVAAFYVALDALPDARAADRWLAALFALMAVVGAVGVLQVALCPVLQPRAEALGALPLVGRALTKCHRARGFYSIYMTLAGALSLVLLAATPRLLPGGGAGVSAWRRVGWLAAGAGLAMTYVRGAWVGFAVGAAALAALVRRGRLLLIAGVVVLVVIVLAVPGVRQRAESIVDPADPTARDRILMWRSAAAMAADHPLLGAGPGGVKREFPRYASPEALQKHRGHLHDTPLQVLVERGVVGLLAWLAVFVAFFVRAIGVLRALPPDAALERALVAGALAAIAGFLVGGLTEYNFGDSEVVTIAWFIMALPFVAARATPGDQYARTGSVAVRTRTK